MKKKIPRVFINSVLTVNQDIFLSKNIVHYIKNVLRMKKNEIIEIFNNTNYIFLAKIKSIQKNIIHVIIFKDQLKNLESSLYIHLGQVISKHEKMDITIQKSVELGVNTITPLFSEYGDITKKFIHLSKKITHWQKIAVSACQQSHRNIIPTIQNPMEILKWCNKYKKDAIKIIFDPRSSLKIKDLSISSRNIRILIGAEKGFSLHEIINIKKSNFLDVSLGPRILRTETAAIAAISILQVKFGDL